jgi:hypothetical protein
MLLATAVQYDTVNLKRVLAAVVSHEPRTLKVSILRPNQNLCQSRTEKNALNIFYS